MIRRSRFLLLLMLLTTAGLAWPPDVAAQRRGPAPRTGVAVPRAHAPGGYYPPYPSHRYYYPSYGHPYYYSPWYYHPGFSFSIGFGIGYAWPGWYWGAGGYPYAYGYPAGYPYSYAYPYPYAYPAAYPYPYYAYDNTGSARLLITPRHAQVYVDGQFVGLVDDFDGSLQRLRVGIGEHELQVYLEGYHTLTQKVLFTRGTTLRIESALQPLAQGEPQDPKPERARATVQAAPYQRQTPAPPRPTREPADFGTLSLRVNPADAVILIDGETWERPQGDNRFSIDLPEGSHQVEVRKEGYRPYMRTITVERGRTLPLNVSLTTGGSDVQVNTRRAVPVNASRQVRYR